MAPGKKQKKSKKKESKGRSSGLAHIASQLVPSAIFAAVPRTSSNLAQTWPKRTPSPIAQAISEAGNVGRIVLGDLSKRPPAEIPVEHREGNVNNDHLKSDRENEAGYESVENFRGKRFDKTTKYFRMTREGQEAEGETSGGPSEHLYHILDHENGQIVKSSYSQVDKKKKKAIKTVDDGEQDEREFLSEHSSSDELTDVTSREDESHAAKESHARRSVSFDDKETQGQSKQRKKSKKERRDGPDSCDGPQSHGKKPNSKNKTSETVEGNCEGAAGEDEERPPPVPPYLGDTSPQAPKRSRRKGRETLQEEAHGLGKLPDGPSEKKLTDEQRQPLRDVERLGFEGVSEKLDLSDVSDDDDSYMSPVSPKTTVDIHRRTSGIPLPPLPRDSPENILTDEQKGALKEVEKLGFDGVSEKLGLSGASEGECSDMFPEVPRNTIDFHGRTNFEQEQFGDTLTESSIPISDARMEEANLTFSHSFAGQVSPEVPDMLQSLNNQPENDNHELDFQRQARKANKVSSFVQMLNQQARQREEQLALHRRASVDGLKSVSLTTTPGNRQDVNQGNVDPSLIQRLEESRQAYETTFLERQEQLESLVQQQKALYEEQVEQQKVQQQQQHEVIRQQWKLQEQLRNLEKMQQEFAENADMSAQGPVVSAFDLQLQRELVKQQQDFLQQQQEQLRQSGVQQTQSLQQQERLCNQIKLLEEQQKELQSSVHLLSPAGKDLAEIKQQEQQIMNLLSEQRQQESEFKKLHLLQQQRLDEQSNSFTQERKALEQQQEMLQQKIKEQEARSKQLEQELKDMTRKHADSEAQLKRRTSLESDSVERRERRRDRNETETSSVRYEKEGRRRNQNQASFQAEEGRHRKKRNVELERRERHSASRVDASYNKARRRRHDSDNSFNADDEKNQQKIGDSDLSLYGDDTEETQPRQRRHNMHGTSDNTERESPHRDRRIRSRPSSSPHRVEGERHLQERDERRVANSSGRTVDLKPVVSKSNAAMTVVQDAKEAELCHLSKGRIELLEAEKSAFMELNTSLQEENKALKQLALSLQKGSGISSLVLQQQIKELHQEKKVLRNTVHRLNVELSRYQAKYRPVSFEEVEGFALPQKNEAAPWLVNTKFLAPLFVAYDDRLKEKEQMIKTYDEELNAFKARVMEVVKENQQLHMSLNKASPDSLGPDEWQQLQEQAKLVVEENGLLMEQQEIQARKMKELQRVHGQEVSKLSKRISSQESVQRRLETELEDLRRNHSNLLRKYEALVAEEENKMSLQDHLKIMEECRSVMEDLKAKTQVEAEDSSSRVQAIQKEKNSLAVKLADSEARNAQLERELDAYQKSLKKSERKFLFLQRKLEHIQERELTAQETLSQVLTVAEKTAAERDNYVEFAKTQKVEQERAVSKILAGTQNIKGLEEKLQEYRRKASDKVAVVTGRLREKEKEINQLREQYETEINNLRALVRQKQRQLELMIGENRNVEKELELVWRTATADNKRMKNTVRQKGGMFDSDSDPNGHLSSEEGDET